jgi:hypothetical protein
MRWEEEITQRPWMPDTLRARYKIYEAYKNGFINWNIFNLALDKIDRVKRGTWMFELTESPKNRT